jgi:hypothetical protein
MTLRTGHWYSLTPTSTPFLFYRIEWGNGGRSSQARGWHVHRDGTVQGTVRPASQALRMREIPAPVGSAFRECERRLGERG